LHTGAAASVSSTYTYPTAPSLNCSNATGLPAGSTINTSTGAVTLPTISPAPASGTVSYNAQVNGIHAVQADTITVIPTGWAYSSGNVILSPAIGGTNGFPASATLATDGTSVTLPAGYNAQSDGIHHPNADIVTAYTDGVFGFVTDHAELSAIPGVSPLTYRRFPATTTIANDGSVALPTGYYLGASYIMNSTDDKVCLIPSSGFTRTGGALALSATTPALPSGSTLASTGVVTLPTISPAPASGTVSYNAQSDGIHAVQADTITVIPTGWAYSSGNVILSPAIGGTNGFPASTTLATDGTGVTLPGGYNAQSDGIHQTHADVVTTPSGFTFGAGSVACDSSSLNATALPSGSSIAVSTGVTTLPVGWDFDGANLYQNGVKGASLPAGFANSNASVVYTKIAGGSTFGLGTIDTQDVITKTLQIDSGAVLKLGAGATWARDITIHS
jgi:hypothetical protein